MEGAASSVKEVFADYPTPIFPNIDRETTREGFIQIHQLISGNLMSVLSNLGGGWHIHLALTMTSKEYAAQKVFAFVTPYNPGNYLPTMGNARDQVLRTEKFRKIQAMFRKYTAVDGSLKKKIITAVEPVFLYPLVDQQTRFGQVFALIMQKLLLSRYRTIYKINLEGNSVKMMGPYYPA